MSRREAEARLASAPWLAGRDTQAVFALLDGAGNRTRAVGGIVRDTLLGITRADAEIDLSTELRPDEVMARAATAGHAAHPTGIEHGTVTLRVGALTVEVTTLREDVETDGRHARVRFGTDWRRDAERRDFTLNALYAGSDGSLFDPLGGLDDCLGRRVRFIGDPDQRIAEDCLRVYRFFRFSASHGEGAKGIFDAEGLAACRRGVGRLGALSAERVGAEMQRLLALPVTAPVIAEMTGSGVLDLELERVAALEALERLEPAARLAQRLAVLTGSPDRLEALQQAWRLSNHTAQAATRLLVAASLIEAGAVGEAVATYPGSAGPAVAVAAALAGRPEAWATRAWSEVMRLDERRAGRDFPIGGHDLIAAGYVPGPGLGAELARLRRAWIESEFTLDRTDLLSML